MPSTEELIITNASVAEITDTDIPDIADFLARQARSGEATAQLPLPPAQRLRWLLLENPARDPLVPMGWYIRGSRCSVVGAALCLPFRIGAGAYRSTALMFAKFYVDVEYRGMGLGLLMRFIRQGNRFPLFVTSTNAVAGALFSRLGAKQINGMDHTLLAVSRVRPLAEELVYRHTGNGPVARLASLSAALLPGRARAGVEGGELQRLTSADQAAQMELPQSISAVAVVRDRDYIHWRYFTGEAGKQVYRFHLDGEADRLVVINEVRSGYRSQIRVLNVLDIWPPATFAAARALVALLQRQYDRKYDVMWLRSQAAEVEAGLCGIGFRRHDFPAPLGWSIDREQRLPTATWYLMPGESE